MAFNGQRFRFQRPYGSHVMENVLFKISYPAEFHAQTAVEAAVKLHPEVGERLDDVERVLLTTHESAIRIISKTGPLANPADRDHCLQYMTAVGLVKGDLTADDYEDAAAADPRIDRLRERMEVAEDARYSREYTRAGQAQYRQRGAGVLRPRRGNGEGGRGVPHRTSSPSCRGAAAIGREIRAQPGDALSRRARPADPRFVFGFGAAGRHTGVRIHGFAGVLRLGGGVGDPAPGRDLRWRAALGSIA